MTDVIEIEGLTKNYGDFVAVNSLSLKIKKNSFVGFLGPNGAGKSTTIKMLTNLTSASSGTAHLNGIDVVKDPKAALTEVGAVVETPEFYPYLTPAKSLEYIARLRGMKKEDIARRTVEVLELVKMDAEKDKKIGKFSKGMKQRVALAQSLMFEPSILILDEPTSGLDPRGMVEVREILQDLRKQDITIFMSSHLLNEVQDICDSVAMMNRGQLLLNSSISDLRKNLETNRIVIETIGKVPKEMADNFRSISSVKGLEVLSENQIAIDFKGDPEAKNSLLRTIDSELRVTSFHESGNPLESMYLGMIKESR
ncbi:MAG: ABC transporter ATP-binding protein [Methanomassiliicoccales archaeon]|nr:ABC transporter ATP-binding protein [Methanomassiliicoccales archaeon]